MPVRAVCACGSVYDLKDEYAGQRLGCPRCGSAVAVPALPPAPPVRRQEGDPVFARDLFLLDERHFAVNEVYSVTDAEGRALLYVERPVYQARRALAFIGGIAAGLVNFVVFLTLFTLARRSGEPGATLVLLAAGQWLGSALAGTAVCMALSRKRHVTVYRDERRSEVLLGIEQDYRVPLFTALYTVYSPDGTPLFKLYKKRLRNILRKRWYCADPDGKPLFMAREDSMILSILRRFLLGFFGLLRTDYRFYCRGIPAGEFNRRVTVRDRYVLDLRADGLRCVDRRAALALGILLDTGEGR